MSAIALMHARAVLDSRGNRTVEVDLRDVRSKRYGGKTLAPHREPDQSRIMAGR